MGGGRLCPIAGATHIISLCDANVGFGSPSIVPICRPQSAQGESQRRNGSMASVGRVVVAGGIHRLRQVDDDRTVVCQQNVELGQVPVHYARAQHAYHLSQQRGVMGQRVGFAECHVVQARCGVAFRVGHQLHQQHAFGKVVRRGHPHTGSG